MNFSRFFKKDDSQSTFSEGSGKVYDVEMKTDSSSAEDNGALDYIPAPRTTGFWRSFSSIICLIVGTGCLQLPYCFAKVGWVAIIIIFVSALIGAYTGNMLIICLYHKGPEKRLHSFPDVGEAAFGKWGKYATVIFGALYSLGVTCLFVILAGQFIHQLVVTRGVMLDKRIWMVIVAVVMWIPLVIMKAMSEAAILGIFGFLCSFVVILTVVIQSFRFPYTKMHPDEPAPNHHVGIGAGVSTALSSIVFSYSGTVIFPHVEESMRNPKQWKLLISSVMMVCACLYTLIGAVGYWAYGDKVVSPVLDSIPTGASTTASLILITLHVIIAGPVLMISLFLEIEKAWNINVERFGRTREFLIRLVYRSLLMAAVAGISVAIPYFSDFLSLLGSLTTTMMFAVFPVAFHYKLYGIWNRPWYQHIWNLIVVVVGMLGCVWGSIDAIRSLIKHSQEDN